MDWQSDLIKHQKDWDVYIPYVLLAYRSSVHASTADTPYFLMHGHDIQLSSTSDEFQQQQAWDSTDDYRHYLTNNMKQIWDEHKEISLLSIDINSVLKINYLYSVIFHLYHL